MIGVFDSGVGGLTVLKELKRKFSSADFVYFGDTARVPYGGRSPKLIQRYATEVTNFLVKKGARVIVVACNTVSANAMDYLKRKFSDVLFIGVIEPVADFVAKEAKRKVGVVATSATVNSGAYKKAILEKNPNLEVFEVECPLLVSVVEYGFKDNHIASKIVRYYSRELRDRKIDTLILGCTHYPLLTPVFKSVMRSRVLLVESGPATASFLEGLIEEKKLNSVLEGNSKLNLYCSDDVESFMKFGKQIFKNIEGLSIEEVSLDELVI